MKNSTRQTLSVSKVRHAGICLIAIGWYTVAIIILSVIFYILNSDLLGDPVLLTSESIKILKMVNIIYCISTIILSLSGLFKFFEAGINLKNANRWI